MKNEILKMEAPAIAEVDVLICGGGPAGTAASIAAARQGARCFLVEQQGCLGGVGTNALVGTWLGSFSRDGAFPVIKGVFAEIVDLLAAERGAIPAEQDVVGGTRHLGYAPWHGRTTPFEFEPCKRVCESLVQKAGVRLRYFTTAVSPTAENGRVAGVFIHSKNGMEFVRAKAVVDATGDADITARAGCAFTKGRPEDGLMSAPSVFPLLEDVDSEAFARYCRDTGDVRLRAVINTLKAKGAWPFEFDILVCCELTRPGRFFINALQQKGIDGTNADQVTAAMIAGRREARVLVDLMRQAVPGFNQARLVETSHVLGVRETRRIVGEHTLTVDEVRTGAAYHDTIALSGYQWDMADPKELSQQHMQGVQFRKPYTEIPYRCLVPRGMDNLIVAGRCVSTEWEAMGVLRVMPACFAMGQAAGIAAAMTARSGIPFRNLDTEELRSRLRADNALLSA
ncbi:MAG: FAD-dependent oxidoreductase [Lentisphaerae bacterium]|nr:FAD-dependent oxidoreductase [Lentisphaerota bacterium]